MDKKHIREFQRSSNNNYSENCASQNTSSSSSQEILEKPKKRSKSKTGSESSNNPKNLWKHLPNQFSKSNETTCIESANVQLLTDGIGTTIRRLSSFFQHHRNSNDGITPITNIEVSPSGYQAAVSATNIDSSEEKTLAMAVQLPLGTTADNVSVTIELEASKINDGSLENPDSNGEMMLKCLEETDSKTIFTGILKAPPNTDITKLANMPLYLIESNEKIILNPGLQAPCRKLVRPSEHMLITHKKQPTLVGDLRIKVTLDRIQDNKRGINRSEQVISKTVSSDESHSSQSTLSKRINESSPAPISNDNVRKDAYSLINYRKENLIQNPITKDKGGVLEKMELDCKRLHDTPVYSTVLEEPVDWLNATYKASSFAMDSINNVETRDASTQYSIRNIFDNKHVETQCSLILTNYGIFNEKFNAMPYASSHTLSTSTPCKSDDIAPKSSSTISHPCRQSSDETVLPKSTTSTTCTVYSNTLISYQSDYSYYDENDLRVPTNSPSSATAIRDNNKEVKCVVQDDSDFSDSTEKIVLKYKMSEQSHIPRRNRSKNTNVPKQSDSLPLDKCSRYDYERSAVMRDNKVHLSHPERTHDDLSWNYKSKKDQTLHLLEDARYKLETFSTTQCPLNITPKFPETKSISMNADHLLNFHVAIRDVGITLDNPSASASTTSQTQTVKETCHLSSFQDKRKESDNFSKTVNIETTFHVCSAELKNSPMTFCTKASKTGAGAKLKNELYSLQNLYADLYGTVEFVLKPVHPIPFSTSKEVSPETPKKVETVDEDLSCTFDDLGKCLTTIDEVLKRLANRPNDVTVTFEPKTVNGQSFDAGISLANESTKSSASLIKDPVNYHFDSTIRNSSPAATQDLLNQCYLEITDRNCLESKTEREKYHVEQLAEERHQTYFNIENEIERAIEDLLKESTNIKETIISNGGKDESEPPFSFEFIDSLAESEPILICGALLEEIAVGSVGIVENGDAPVDCILDMLLDQVDQSIAMTTEVSEKEMPETTTICQKDIEDFFGRVYKISEEDHWNDLQIGDVNSKEGTTSKVDNDPLTYFCPTSSVLNSKILKTSFSFGETQGKHLEILNTNCKIPVRRRDCLSTGKDVENSRIFNELLHLQSDFNHKPLDSKMGGISSEEKCLHAEEFATVAHVLVKSQPESEYLQELLPTLRPTNELSVHLEKNITSNARFEALNSNINEQSTTSESDTPNQLPKDEDRNDLQCSPTTIPGSRKFLNITNNHNNNNWSKNDPLASTSYYLRDATTTGDESFQQDFDLIGTTDSQTDEEGLLLLENVSKHICTSETSSSSNEEALRYITNRRPPLKKTPSAEIIEIKAKCTISSDSESEHVAKTRQPLINSDQGLVSQNSHIVLKSARAYSHIQCNVEGITGDLNELEHPSAAGHSFAINKEENADRDKSISNLSFDGSILEISETEYEGDYEICQVTLLDSRHRFRSMQELNAPEEISKIEANVTENDYLQRKMMALLITTDTNSLLLSENISNISFSVDTGQSSGTIDSSETAEENTVTLQQTRFESSKSA